MKQEILKTMTKIHKESEEFLSRMIETLYEESKTNKNIIYFKDYNKITKRE